MNGLESPKIFVKKEERSHQLVNEENPYGTESRKGRGRKFTVFEVKKNREGGSSKKLYNIIKN